HQRVERNLNQVLPDNPNRAGIAGGQFNANLARPFPGFATVTYGETSTNSNYNSLQVNLRMENYKGLTLQTAYTWSHSIDIGSNTGSGDFAGLTNAYDLAFDRGNSQYDRRHILTINYDYELPFFRSYPSRLVQGTLGGWEFSGITTFQRGLPLTVTYSAGDNAGVGGATTRPDLVGDPNNGPKTVDQWFNTAAFVAPGPLSFGSAGRSIVFGPGRNNWNLSLFKTFAGIPFPTSPEGARIEFRVETFNTFNHTQLHNIGTTLGAGQFGQATSAYDPRVVQLALKFSF